MAAPDVTNEDQQRINIFHRSWQRLKEINAELEGRSVGASPHKLREDCEDASNELMLVDDSEVRYVVGECFYHATPEEAEARLQERSGKVMQEQEKLQGEANKIQGETAELKKVLYGKFGASINLEE